MALLLDLLRARVSPTVVPPDPGLKPVFFDMLRLATWHDVMPALKGGLSRLDDPAWRDLLPFVTAAARANEDRNLLYLHSASAVSRALAEASIPHVFAKGLAFFLDDPASLEWRTVSDIDLHVKEADLAGAASVIQSLGYRQSRPGAAYAPHLHHHAAALRDDRTGIFYELHTRMMQAPRQNPFGFDEMFAASRVVRSGGLDMRIPSPEHRMFNLIAHAQISNWDYALRQVGIRSLLDAAELSQRHAIDWTSVARLFAQIRATPEFMAFLVEGRRMLGLRAGIEDSAGPSAQRWADEAIAALGTPPSRVRTTLRIWGQYCRMIAQHPQRLEMVWHTFSSPGRFAELMDTLRGRLR